MAAHTPRTPPLGRSVRLYMACGLWSGASYVKPGLDTVRNLAVIIRLLRFTASHSSLAGTTPLFFTNLFSKEHLARLSLPLHHRLGIWTRFVRPVDCLHPLTLRNLRRRVRFLDASYVHVSWTFNPWNKTSAVPFVAWLCYKAFRTAAFYRCETRFGNQLRAIDRPCLLHTLQ